MTWNLQRILCFKARKLSNYPVPVIEEWTTPFPKSESRSMERVRRTQSGRLRFRGPVRSVGQVTGSFWRARDSFVLTAPVHLEIVRIRLTSATALIVSEIIAASSGFGWDDMMAMTIRFRRSTNRYWP